MYASGTVCGYQSSDLWICSDSSGDGERDTRTAFSLEVSKVVLMQYPPPPLSENLFLSDRVHEHS